MSTRSDGSGSTASPRDSSRRRCCRPARRGRGRGVRRELPWTAGHRRRGRGARRLSRLRRGLVRHRIQPSHRRRLHGPVGIDHVFRNDFRGHRPPAVLLGAVLLGVMVFVVAVTVVFINREGARSGSEPPPPAASGAQPGSVSPSPGRPSAQPPGESSEPSPGAPDPSASGPSGSSSGRSAPSRTFAVGVRHLALQRTVVRPLPTTVWYPASGTAGSAPEPDARVAGGRFPFVLLSHGMPSLPETYTDVAVRLAAAGFVVAAPRYPNTNLYSASPTMADVPNQPTDALSTSWSPSSGWRRRTAIRSPDISTPAGTRRSGTRPGGSRRRGCSPRPGTDVSSPQ